jgi:double zinc ribbon protein
MGLLAVFGITNDGLNLVVSLLILFLAAIWLALVYWTYADARRRIADPMLVGCATAAALFPYIGTTVYMIVRPPEYLDDVRERELEIAAAEARLAETDHLNCAYCGFEIERSFLRCPSCLRRLKEPCATCGKPLDPRWKICPYCEAEIAGAPAAQRRRARPAAAGGKRAAARPQSAAATPKAAEQRAVSRARSQAQAVPDEPAAATRRPRSS